MAGSLIPSGINCSISKKQSDLAYERTKEFAQDSLQWRVQDAKKAGITPLAALGFGAFLISLSLILLAVTGLGML